MSGGAPRRLAVPLVVLAVLLSACRSGPGDDPLLVAGAADLMPAFTLIGEAFEAATSDRVTFNFGSSGQLAQQVIEGAPMDIYASANVSFVERVLAAGVGDADTQQTYAIGRIAIWSTAARWGDWNNLDDLAADTDAGIVAIANPEHAPYGLAAKQALESVGVWEAIQPRLVFGENIADTQRLAASGNADVAIVALSLALASDQVGDGRWVLVDDALHEPLQQDLLVVTDDPDRAARAARFVAFVMSEEGRDVMRRFGFLLPGEPTPDTWER
jgi:molybdate transport system substrate-binding protein